MSAVKERLREDVDALVGESIDAVSTDELGADLIDIRRAVDRLEAEFVRRLHRFDRAGGSLADGVGTVSWLRAGCGMTAKATAYRVRRPRHAHDPGASPDRARPARSGLPLPGVRPTARVDRCPPHHSLGERRADRDRELGIPLPPASPPRARGGVAHPRRRGECRLRAAALTKAHSTSVREPAVGARRERNSR